MCCPRPSLVEPIGGAAQPALLKEQGLYVTALICVLDFHHKWRSFLLRQEYKSFKPALVSTNTKAEWSDVP